MTAALDWRFSVRRVRLDAQGYDDMGCYYGVGPKVWEVTRAGNQHTGFGNGFHSSESIRAPSLKAAIAYVKALDSRYRHVRDCF